MYGERKKEWIDSSKKKWQSFAEGFADAMYALGISEEEFCSMSGEKPSGESYGKTVLNHIVNDSNYGTKEDKDHAGNYRGMKMDGRLLVFPKILERIDGKKSGACTSVSQPQSTVASEFLSMHAGAAISETYSKLASYGGKPELMGIDPVFCTSILRDLSARKSLGRVLSSVSEEKTGELTNEEISELVSKIIKEKRGIATVDTNLLIGKPFEAIVKEYSQELAHEIDDGDDVSSTGLAELKKELVPGFTDTDALSESILEKILSEDAAYRKAMLFFAGRFLLRKK